MNLQKDISSILISEQAVQQILPSILVDAIVLDERFTILAVSQNVLDYIGFTNDELKNQPINYLAGGKDLLAVLKTGLAAGYFSEKRTRLFSKGKKWISVSITGFYLGLISDLNGSIILKIRNLDELDLMNKQLLLKKAELDDFIYRTSHDLRGPLATIKGLVHLMKLRQNNDELDSLVGLLVERTNKLDERLSQLLYLSHAEREADPPKNIVDFKAIEEAVRKIGSENGIPAFVKFLYSSPKEPLHGLNEIQLLALLTNLLMHILSLPMSRLDGSISVDIRYEGNSLRLKIGALGFIVNESLKEALSRSEFIYSDILNYPQLVNYFTAQKIASGLQSHLDLHLIAEDKQRLSLSIPINTKMILAEEDFQN